MALWPDTRHLHPPRRTETAGARLGPGIRVALATAAGASILLHLDEERTWHALSIAAVANVPCVPPARPNCPGGRVGDELCRTGRTVHHIACGGGNDGPRRSHRRAAWPQGVDQRRVHLQPFRREQLPDAAGPNRSPARLGPPAGGCLLGIELGRKVTVENLKVGRDSHTYWSPRHETGSEEAKRSPRTRAHTQTSSTPYVFLRSFQEGALNLSASRPRTTTPRPGRPGDHVAHLGSSPGRAGGSNFPRSSSCGRPPPPSTDRRIPSRSSTRKGGD